MDHETAFRVSALFVYPVKSAGGFSVEAWDLDAFGFRHDRRFMVVTSDGRFITQRDVPRLALVRARVAGEALVLTAAGMPDLALPLAPRGGAAERVVVWDDTVDARHAGAGAEAWLTRFLGRPCHLVHMPEESLRSVPPSPASAGERVSFVDAFPLLVISESSLADLNTRLASPLPMNRFRPNVVVAGPPPYAEDAWQRARAGDVELALAIRCGRCATTTIDQASAERGVEPLRTLATYRREGSDVMFGRYALHRGAGALRVGDPVEVLEESLATS